MTHTARARRLAAATLLLAAPAVTGCGLGAGGSVGGVTVVVTRDFGQRPLPGSPAAINAPGGETAMRALQRRFRVTTRYGGGFVQSIGGLAGGRDGGRPVDWFYYVNGIEAPRGAAGTELNRGDVIWWDRHDWGTAQRVPAVVGSFPEPFVHGIGGRRLPTRIECAPGADSACGEVAKRLDAEGVIAGEATLGTRSGDQALRIVVGPWAQVKPDFTLREIAKGPAASGVYAVPSDDGRSITTYDERGRRAGVLGAGTGLIAATAVGDGPPVWLVTGTDAAGLELAARSLTIDALRNKFAVAVRDDVPMALPATKP